MGHLSLLSHPNLPEFKLESLVVLVIWVLVILEPADYVNFFKGIFYEPCFPAVLVQAWADVSKLIC